jgi:hypothetical protein
MTGAVTLIVVLMGYPGVGRFPDAARHSGDDIVKPEHAGSWRWS